MTKRDKLIEMIQNRANSEEITEKVGVIVDVDCKACIKEFDECKAMCIDSLDKYLDTEYIEPITLSDKEIELLNALKILEFEYIARNEDGCLYAFKEKPEKHGKCWDDNSVCYHSQKIDKDLLQFVQWSDNEPYSVDEL